MATLCDMWRYIESDSDQVTSSAIDTQPLDPGANFEPDKIHLRLKSSHSDLFSAKNPASTADVAHSALSIKQKSMHLWQVVCLALVTGGSLAQAASGSSSGSQLSSKGGEEGDSQIPLFDPSTSSKSVTLDPNEWAPDSTLDPSKWSPDGDESASGSASVDEDSKSGSAHGSSETLSGDSASRANANVTTASSTTSLRGSSSASHARETSGSGSALDSECANSTVWVSVEAMDGVFCLPNGVAVCSGNTAYGKCPEAQSGLLYGSYCAEIHPHIFGCRPWAKPVSSPNGLPSSSTGGSSNSTTPA